MKSVEDETENPVIHPKAGYGKRRESEMEPVQD